MFRSLPSDVMLPNKSFSIEMIKQEKAAEILGCARVYTNRIASADFEVFDGIAISGQVFSLVIGTITGLSLLICGHDQSL